MCEIQNVRVFTVFFAILLEKTSELFIILLSTVYGLHETASLGFELDKILQFFLICNSLLCVQAVFDAMHFRGDSLVARKEL